MEKSKLRKVGMGLALVAVAGLAFYAVQAPAEAPQYLTAPVERSDIENAVLATGLLEGIKQVDVGAQVSGQLKSLKVKVGDKVKKGQWLAIFMIITASMGSTLSAAKSPTKVTQE